MCNESDCFTCPHHDCVSDEPPTVDLDCYMQFGLDRFAGDCPVFDVPEVEVMPEKGLERLILSAFQVRYRLAAASYEVG